MTVSIGGATISGGVNLGNYIPLVTNGLVLNLDAGNTSSYSGSGSTWVDLSGNGYNGTLINSPVFVNTGSSSSFTFDGTSQYVDLGTSLASSFSSNALTVIAIAQISAIVSKNTLFSFGGSGAQQGQFNGFLPGNRLTDTYQLYWDAVYSWQHGNNNSWNLNQWYYFGWTVSNTNTLTFYYNEKLDGIVSPVNTFSPVGTSRLGLGNAGEYATGKIAQVMMYNRVLTPAEVSQNFQVLRGRYGL